jgi:phosphoribosylamine--glycine ligase
MAGLGDACAAAHVRFFGPSRAAAEIEGSKKFAKDLMRKAGIPTAAYGSFSDVAAAEAFIDAQPGNVVVKADGLCAGKGVVVASSRAEAKQAVRAMLEDRTFGEAGARVVIEERLVGREVSMMALCDGTRFVLLDSAEDHKAVLDGDRGPNTGGMGAYSPVASRRQGAGRIHRAHHLRAVGGRHGRRGPALSRLALRRLDADPRSRAHGHRVELPLRRSRNPGRASAPGRGSSALAARRGLWAAAPALPGLASRPGGVRGAGRRRLPRQGSLGRCHLPAWATTGSFLAKSGRHRRVSCRDQARPGTPVTSGGRVLGVTANGNNLDEARSAGLRWHRPHYLARHALSQRHWNARHTMSETTCDVAILMGSKSDLPTMKPAADVLKALGLRVAVRVLSAHRTPEQTAAFVREAARTGTKVFICGAGGAAHLAGTVAAHTTRPVIGIPIAAGSLQGMDALLVHRHDAARNPGGDGGHRRRRERGSAGRADRGDFGSGACPNAWMPSAKPACARSWKPTLKSAPSSRSCLNLADGTQPPDSGV